MATATSVSALTTESRKRILRAAIFTPINRGRWGLPLVLWGPPGCLASDTSIQYEARTPGGRRRTKKTVMLERFYQLFNRKIGPGKGRYQLSAEDSVYFVGSVDDEGYIMRNRVTAVTSSGTRECFRLCASNGAVIEATADHRFMTPAGFVAVGELMVGDTVLFHSNTIERLVSGERIFEGHRATSTVKHHPTAALCKVSARIGRSAFRSYVYKRLPRARLVMEAHINGLTAEEYRERLNAGTLDGLRFLPRDVDVHHRDENFTNDSVENLQIINHDAHARHHSVGTLRYVATTVQIISIKAIGRRETYDVSVQAPYSNLVASGFVVHNCAKTAVINQTVAECGLACKLLSPGRSGDGAFGVTPVPAQNAAGKLCICYPEPAWVAMFEETGRGVLFCDELTANADDTIQAASLGMISEREIAGAELALGVRVLGAANPADVAAGGRELAFPVLNRTGHLEWPAPSVDEHVAYMMREDTGNGGHTEQKLDPAAEEARVLAAWPEAWAVARGLETAFLSRRPALKNQTFTAGMRACATDRTWEMAARAYASSIVHGLSQAETEEFVACFIGAGPASEWFRFIEAQDLPDPAKLLDGKEKWEHDRGRIDRTAAVLNACVALVTPQSAEKRVERTKALWAIIGSMVIGPKAADKDIAVPAVTALSKAGLHTEQSAWPVIAAVLNTLCEAGVTP